MEIPLCLHTTALTVSSYTYHIQSINEDTPVLWQSWAALTAANITGPGSLVSCGSEWFFIFVTPKCLKPLNRKGLQNLPSWKMYNLKNYPISKHSLHQNNLTLEFHVSSLPRNHVCVLCEDTKKEKEREREGREKELRAEKIQGGRRI